MKQYLLVGVFLGALQMFAPLRPLSAFPGGPYPCGKLDDLSQCPGCSTVVGQCACNTATGNCTDYPQYMDFDQQCGVAHWTWSDEPDTAQIVQDIWNPENCYRYRLCLRMQPLDPCSGTNKCYWDNWTAWVQDYPYFQWLPC